MIAPLTCRNGVGEGPQPLTHHAAAVPRCLVVDTPGKIFQSFFGHLLLAPGIQQPPGPSAVEGHTPTVLGAGAPHAVSIIATGVRAVPTSPGRQAQNHHPHTKQIQAVHIYPKLSHQ